MTGSPRLRISGTALVYGGFAYAGLTVAGAAVGLAMVVIGVGTLVRQHSYQTAPPCARHISSTCALTADATVQELRQASNPMLETDTMTLVRPGASDVLQVSGEPGIGTGLRVGGKVQTVAWGGHVTAVVVQGRRLESTTSPLRDEVHIVMGILLVLASSAAATQLLALVRELQSVGRQPVFSPLEPRRRAPA